MKYLFTFSVLMCACVLHAQPSGLNLPAQTLQRITQTKESLLALTTVHDYLQYEFDWDFIEEQWDSVSYTNTFALDENGQLNLYMYGHEYDAMAGKFILNEYTIIYGLNAEIGPDPEFFDDAVFFADSLYSYFLDEDSGEFIPALIGYLTQHPNGKLESFEVFINSTGALEPPFELQPFVSIRLYYDAQDRIITQVENELDIFDLTFYHDSTLFVWNSNDQLLRETSYDKDTLNYDQRYHYDGDSSTPFAWNTDYYEDGTIVFQDSVHVEFISSTDYTQFHFRHIVGQPSGPILNTIVEFKMFGDSASLETIYTVENAIPTPTYDTRRTFDSEQRLVSVLERDKFPFDVLTNRYLTIYQYPEISSISSDNTRQGLINAWVSDHDLIVEADQAFTGTVLLISSDGKIVKAVAASGTLQLNVPLAGLPAGVYSLVLNSKTHFDTKQFFYGGE